MLPFEAIRSNSGATTCARINGRAASSPPSRYSAANTASRASTRRAVLLRPGGRNKTALLVDALEAVLAALYLDGGLEAARPFILAQVVAPELERIASNGSMLPVNDYKSALQEKLQATGRPQPQYVLVKERGPEHNKTFTVEARLQSREAKPEYKGRAEGSTKKNAEQHT